MSTRLRKVERFNTDVVDNREILRVLTSFKNGNFSVRMPVDATGIAGKIYDALNEVIGSNERLAKELERVGNLIGKEGKINHRAAMPGATGSWAACIDSVNMLATDLIQPTVDVSRVIGAIAQGDLSQRMAPEIDGLPFRGVFRQTVKTVNTMVDQLSTFTSEVIRVAREVGTEGKLGGQAQVKDVGGTWKDLTDGVNFMASNLTNQVRNIAAVTTAVAGGDLSKKITVDARGEILELKDTINIMVDQLNSFASEVTRVAREVGTEGRLGGQADVRGVGGTWKDLTDSVNSMASNLTAQVRNIAEVTTAVALGDLSKTITVDVRGEILELKNTINTMVDQLNSFASEVTRVAREVGTDGRLGGQAQVRGVGGTWKDLTDSVNSMASNLTAQVRNIAEVTTSVAKGDLSKKITVDVRGEILELKNTINTMLDQLNSFASEVTRVAREVGTEGRLGGQAQVSGVGGTWKDLTDSVNFMASNLTNQVRNIAAVTTAVATGDLSKKITVDVRGEILELKNTVNIMVDQLNSFASEVTRVAREVGTEGKLGGQADVKGVAGTWKDLTDGVNSMASNLTNQVRSISKVVKEVASGNLKRKLVLDVKGEIADFADTINEMIDTLATFADQVTTVAREVGTQGKLGGQANVPGATGTWRDLTDNVNRLAANLTTQVRAIAEVATAVTKWDLSRSIKVEAAGEVAALKDNLNEMIRNLKDTTEKSAAQDWLKTNLAKFTRLVQGQRDLLAVSRLILSELAPLVSMQHGVFYLKEQNDGEQEFRLVASYAFKERKTLSSRFRLGEGLVGQAGFERQRILLTEAPSDYIQISSGLGESKPLNIVLLPVLFEGEVKAVVELASFSKFTDIHLTFLDQLGEIIGIMLNTITATMRTEDLLKKSQALAAELQSRQAELTTTNSRLQEQAKSLRESEEALKLQKEELKQTNDKLEDKARLLAQQNREVESNNAEIERARRSLEEKAEQLALSSKYKSDFLANMSHELRTPLNSMLILAKLLVDNTEQNLSRKQIEYAEMIGASGSDLLALINEILDLSKIEAGVMQVEVTSVFISEIENYIDQTFRHVAESKSLDFIIDIGADVPQVIETDAQRLQQVLKNLLSNACKFTEEGGITVRIHKATEGWSPGHQVLSKADTVVAFSVVDTGIGIAPDKHQIIFEAFQQAEGGTSRRFGGTGLGLSISRELARMLGGEIQLASSPGRGSTFTLYLPQSYPPSAVDSGSHAKRIEAPVGAPKATGAPKEHSHPSTRRFVLSDDRASIGPDDSVAVIIEDDAAFARILLDAARSKGFKGIVVLDGEESLNAVQQWKPHAIVLDLHLPGTDGWSILDYLKHNPSTRHIPVQIVSVDDERAHCLGMGAIGYVRKPATYEQIDQALSKLKAFTQKKERSLLVVEEDLDRQKSIVELIGNGDVRPIAVATGRAALDVLLSTDVDCVVMDIALPDMTGFELIESIRKELKLHDLRIVLYTGRELTQREEMELRSAAETLIVKEVRSLDRLVDEASLFLHRVEFNLPEDKREKLASLHRSDPALEGKKILIIDDDIRNIFALTSLFEQCKMRVFFAETGRDGIETLERTPDMDAVIVDIMMPGMDGHQTMRAIRANPRFAFLPLFALTAKAMKGDREACLEAGATDYIAKPADTDHVMSLLRAHVSRQSRNAQ